MNATRDIVDNLQENGDKTNPKSTHASLNEKIIEAKKNTPLLKRKTSVRPHSLNFFPVKAKTGFPDHKKKKILPLSSILPPSANTFNSFNFSLRITS